MPSPSDKMPLNSAIRAVKTRSITPTFTDIFRPSVVPLAMASSQLPLRSTLMLAMSTTGSVWGTRILAIQSEAGAFITEAVSRWRAKKAWRSGSVPPKYPMYAARTAPARVAIPPTIRAMSSERVMLEM